MLKTLKNGDENAYPQGSHSCGLTKRELFAAMAMQGLFAAAAHPEHVGIQRSEYRACADEAVLIADALLAALSEPLNQYSSQEKP